MSYSIGANILLYASDSSSASHQKAKVFLTSLASENDLLCLAWPTLMAYLRISTHPSIFTNPLAPADAWRNMHSLLDLPR